MATRTISTEELNEFSRKVWTLLAGVTVMACGVLSAFECYLTAGTIATLAVAVVVMVLSARPQPVKASPAAGQPSFAGSAPGDIYVDPHDPSAFL